MLSKVDRRKASLANLLATPEVPNDLIRFLFGILRWRWATAHSSRRRSWCRHDVCPLCLSVRLYHFYRRVVLPPMYVESEVGR